jgi:UDP-GlcNAc:undecaprenyl-phosphate GlcNAc-1-phosphate transferase
MRVSQAQRLLEERRRNMELRSGIRRVGTTMRSARSLGDVWVSLRRAAMVLEANAVALHLAGDPEPMTEGFAVLHRDALRARFSVYPERPGETYVEFAWTDGRTFVDRDTEIAVELLCEQLAGVLGRFFRADTPRTGLGRVADLTEGLARVVNLRR